MVDSEEFYQVIILHPLNRLLIFSSQLLVSHDVGGRLFPPQVEHLNESFQELLAALPSKQVGLDLQQFATVARMLITIVYRNTFSSAVSMHSTPGVYYTHIFIYLSITRRSGLNWTPPKLEGFG